LTLLFVCLSVLVAFQFVRIAIIFRTYSQLERFAFQLRIAPSESAMVMEAVLTFFSQTSLLAAPFIVWRSGFGRRGVN
jgi:hypothetical protein